MFGDWQPFLQSIIIGVIFSYLLAKLISVVVAFKDDNLRITRDDDSTKNDEPEPPKSSKQHYDPRMGHQHGVESLSRAAYDTDSVMGEVGSVRNNESVLNSSDDDDDWEGVESTELDEAFSAATAFVAAAAVDKRSSVSTDMQLQLYALYKIATEGPCSGPQPPAYKMTARAKWQAWQKMGAMPPEEAMIKYLDVVTELYPTWVSGAAAKRKSGDGPGGTDTKGPMGPVFSSFVYEEESGTELKMDAIHAFAREGEVNNLLKCFEKGVQVNSRDSEGRTPLHWAVDRGHFDVVQALVSNNADVNAKDDEGQTPLHYAIVCDRESIAEYLVKENADLDVKDNDGNAPRGLCESEWSWLAILVGIFSGHINTNWPM